MSHRFVLTLFVILLVAGPVRAQTSGTDLADVERRIAIIDKALANLQIAENLRDSNKDLASVYAQQAQGAALARQLSGLAGGFVGIAATATGVGEEVQTAYGYAKAAVEWLTATNKSDQAVASLDLLQKSPDILRLVDKSAPKSSPALKAVVDELKAGNKISQQQVVDAARSTLDALVDMAEHAKATNIKDLKIGNEIINAALDVAQGGKQFDQATTALNASADTSGTRERSSAFKAALLDQKKTWQSVRDSLTSFVPPEPGTAAYASWTLTQSKVATEMLASGGSYVPPKAGTAEYVAWQRNQAKIGAELVASGVSFTPPTAGTAAHAGWQATQAAIAAKVLSRAGAAPSTTTTAGVAFTPPTEIDWRTPPDSPGVDFGTYTKTAPDGRLRAVLTWKNTGTMLQPQYSGSWVVYDDAQGGKVVGSYNGVTLLNNGHYVVSTVPDPTRPSTIGRPVEPDYTIYAAGAAAPTPVVSGKGAGVQVSQDGRLRAVLNYYDHQYGGPQSGFSMNLPVGRWTVFDDANGGKVVGTYDAVSLSSGGQFQATNAPRCETWPCTGPDGKALGPQSQVVDVNKVIGPPKPATGGIYLGGQQQYQETKGVDDKVEKKIEDAEVVPKKKKGGL